MQLLLRKSSLCFPLVKAAYHSSGKNGQSYISKAIDIAPVSNLKDAGVFRSFPSTFKVLLINADLWRISFSTQRWTFTLLSFLTPVRILKSFLRRLTASSTGNVRNVFCIVFDRPSLQIGLPSFFRRKWKMLETTFQRLTQFPNYFCKSTAEKINACLMFRNPNVILLYEGQFFSGHKRWTFHRLRWKNSLI